MDDDGFRAFVNGRWSALVATAYLVTADRGVAEDCVQEALARVHRRWPRLRDEGSPAAYAHRAVVNAALSWRRRRKIAEVPLPAGFDIVADDLDPGAAVDPVLLAALRSLPPRMRAAVVLRYLEDRSEAETAQILGCSVGTVKSATSRGVARLRQALAATAPGGTTSAGTPASTTWAARRRSAPCPGRVWTPRSGGGSSAPPPSRARR
jgi:RNA polymerase sigma-70 factor (sigma-E family)